MEVRSTLVSRKGSAFVLVVAWLLGGLAMPACSGSPGPSSPTSPTSASPASPTTAPARRAQVRQEAPKTVFTALEEQLSQTPLRLRFELRAEGAVVVSLGGSLVIDEEVELEARGQFAGVEQELRLWTEGDRLRAGPRDGPTLDVPRPPALASALVIGMTRMGLLHNVAMLSAGRVPDGADGGVREWVQTVEHQHVGEGEGAGLGFVLVVAGQRMGRATLWLDAQGRPARREQTVDFPEGQMKVSERYWWPEPLPERAG